MSAHETIEWTAMERKGHSHAPDWYWAVSIIAISIAVTAVILNNMLFAVLVALSTVVLFLRTLQKPREMQYALTVKGLWINKEFSSWKSLESFWVEDAYGEPMLIVKSKGLIAPLICIPLEGLEPEAVRDYLLTALPEVEHHEPLSKRIMEFLGF